MEGMSARLHAKFWVDGIPAPLACACTRGPCGVPAFLWQLMRLHTLRSCSSCGRTTSCPTATSWPGPWSKCRRAGGSARPRGPSGKRRPRVPHARWLQGLSRCLTATVQDTSSRKLSGLTPRCSMRQEQEVLTCPEPALKGILSAPPALACVWSAAAPVPGLGPLPAGAHGSGAAPRGELGGRGRWHHRQAAHCA